MKVLLKLLAFGSLAAAVVYAKQRRRFARRGAYVQAAADLGIAPSELIDEELRSVATESGIADVDPEPISHVAGEGIDPERDVRAHEELAELRARLPG